MHVHKCEITSLRVWSKPAVLFSYHRSTSAMYYTIVLYHNTASDLVMTTIDKCKELSAAPVARKRTAAPA